jgi:hypothetical protein
MLNLPSADRKSESIVQVVKFQIGPKVVVMNSINRSKWTDRAMMLNCMEAFLRDQTVLSTCSGCL